MKTSTINQGEGDVVATARYMSALLLVCGKPDKNITSKRPVSPLKAAFTAPEQRREAWCRGRQRRTAPDARLEPRIDLECRGESPERQKECTILAESSAPACRILGEACEQPASCSQPACERAQAAGRASCR